MTQLLAHQSPTSFLPLELATKYYTRWDCQIQVKSTPNGYFKCLHGYGQVEFTNGNVFKGTFKNGLMHGQGQFVWSCGLKYKGPFVSNAITGHGVYQWSDGSWYKGELLNGKRHIKGEYYCHKDKSRYNGEWKHGIRHGHGMLQFSQQCSYEGDFHEGLRHGKGKMKYASGNVYEGEWLNDKKSGYGVMNWFTQNQKYEGEWRDDLQHGFGTYYWFDGKIQYKIVKNIYKGYWAHGERQGFGSFFYSNGCRYEGYFDKNQKHGEGLVMDENGNVKLEIFQKDKLTCTIPESHLAMLSMNSKVPVQNQTNIELKPAQKLPKLTTKNSHSSRAPSMHESSTPGSKLSSVPKSSFKQNPTQQIVPTTKNTDFPTANLAHGNQPKLKIEDNIYAKCLDVPISCEEPQTFSKQSGHRFIICKQIMNLLLRENSHLRLWYKHCSLTVGNSGNNNTQSKDFYTGVTIQNLFKLLKDLRVIDDFITIPKINREFFYQGWKSNFDITLPNQNKIAMVKEYLQKHKHNAHGDQDWDALFNNEKVNYSNIEWYNYAMHIQRQLADNLGQNGPNTAQYQAQIDLNLFNDIQNPKKIILFRHFVSYLLRIAYLQTLKTHISKPSTQQSFQKCFRLTLEKLFKTINSTYEASQRQGKVQSTDNLTFVSKERSPMNLPADYAKPNEELFAQLTKTYRNMHNFADNTVTVKVLYQLLEKFAILKQLTEKMLFLQKIERFIEPGVLKQSLLRKQLKGHFGSLQKVIYTSPYFQRILNYTLIQKEFQELLYMAINRKISSQSKQDTVQKYRESIDQIIKHIKQQSSSKPEEPEKTSLKLKKIISAKDQQKIMLIKQDEEKKAAERQAERQRQERKQEEWERQHMTSNDFKWEEEEEIQECDEYFD